MSDPLAILSGDELLQLADLIYRKEVEVIKSRPFKSSIERDGYLADCGSAYDSVVAILKSARESVAKYQNDDTKGPIAHDMFHYAEKAVNTALQIVKNYSVRVSYLKKLRDHTNSLLAALDEIDSQNVTNVSRLAKDAVKYRDAMLNCIEKHKSGLSAQFSKWVKTEKLTFHQLVQKYQSELGYEGAFSDLEDAQKLNVYEEIIQASGRGNVFKMELIMEAGGVAVLLFAAGMMVWDIYSSDHKIETTTRDVVDTAVSIGSGMLGDVVAGIVKTALADTIEATTMFAVTAGLLTSFVGGFIIGAFAGAILDAIFGSGGTAHLSTDGITCFVAPLPDGAVLARQIWHEDHVQPLSDKAR